MTSGATDAGSLDASATGPVDVAEVPPEDAEPVARSNGAGARAPELVPDFVHLEVPRGGRCFVVSDLHLTTTPGEAAATATATIVGALEEWKAPGLLVIAGDGFEMLAGPPDLDRILDANADFTREVSAFAAREDHQVVVLPGNHDGQIAWDPAAVSVAKRRLGAVAVALACDVTFQTGAGPEVVRIVHGNQLDPYNAFRDPRSPIDTPFGHHIVTEVVPQLKARQESGSILEGVEYLNEAGEITDFLASRVLYRKIVGRAWWLAVPFLAAIALRLLTFIPGVGGLLHQHAIYWLVVFGILVVLVVLVAVVTAAATMLRANRSLAESTVGQRGGAAIHNSNPRELAARLVNEGYAGLISGHTHEPELSVVRQGFYANTGCGTEVVIAHKARFGLPRTFVQLRRFSRVEVDAGSELRVRLVLVEHPIRSPSILERLATTPEKLRPSVPTVVGALPDGETWPLDEAELGPWTRRRLVRQAAWFLLVAAGALNIVFALLWPVRATRAVDWWLPFGAHPISGAGAILGGLALLGLAKGVRFGYRRAWAAAILVLLVSSVVRFSRGRGIEGSVIALMLVCWLISQHVHFRVSPPGTRRYVGWVIISVLTVIAVLAGADVVFPTGQGERGDVTALVLGAAVLLILIVARPGRYRPRTGADRDDAFDRARDIVSRCGGDTLDYFALRDDKSWFFSGESVVAYTVLNRVMLVSPDPVGPPGEREEVWSDTMEFADQNGWTVAVLAARESWLPIYRSAGLRDVYIGDEAIVDCSTFSLQGKAMKSLRGAYNRVSKSGCTVEVMDPVAVSGVLKEQLLELMTETRQGEVERGYSMTLSRMFDPRDDGLLLAVCFDAERRPMAFNQYIPARAIEGYSLDVMRRTNAPDAPNGLTDFVIIETIKWMADNGYRGLGLNFATMRAVVAGEDNGGPWRHMERSVLHRFSDTMQIESLWVFNKKYGPEWRPRYVVTDASGHAPRAGLAIARAEAVTELPFVGRLLNARGDTNQPAATPRAPGVDVALAEPAGSPHSSARDAEPSA